MKDLWKKINIKTLSASLIYMVILLALEGYFLMKHDVRNAIFIAILLVGIYSATIAKWLFWLTAIYAGIYAFNIITAIIGHSGVLFLQVIVYGLLFTLASYVYYHRANAKRVKISKKDVDDFQF